MNYTSEEVAGAVVGHLEALRLAARDNTEMTAAKPPAWGPSPEIRAVIVRAGLPEPTAERVRRLGYSAREVQAIVKHQNRQQGEEGK